MGRSRYIITEADKPHFMTCTVVEWLAVFTRPKTVYIVLNSWQYQRQHAGFAYALNFKKYWKSTMNKQNISVSLLLCGMLAVSASAYAEGELDEIWFGTRIKTTLKKYHSLKTAGVDALNDAAVKFDSGNCYTGLKWMGQGSQLYKLIAICQGQNGWAWDNGDSAMVNQHIDNAAPSLYEMADGSLANELGSIIVPKADSAYPAQEAAGYLGSVVLIASFYPDHRLKDAKLISAKNGTIYYANEAQKVFGTGPSGLSMKRVDLGKVPAAAIACFDSVNGGAPVADCPVGDWVIR